MTSKTPRYQSYILRLWEEPRQHPTEKTWRFSLEDPQTKQRHGFSTFEALVAALRVELIKDEEGYVNDTGKNS